MAHTANREAPIGWQNADPAHMIVLQENCPCLHAQQCVPNCFPPVSRLRHCWPSSNGHAAMRASAFSAEKWHVCARMQQLVFFK
jgi:hypothetical protein